MRLPGMAIEPGALASVQAIASAGSATPRAFAQSRSFAMRAVFDEKFGSMKRGLVLRKSPSWKAAMSGNVSTKMPRPRGENETNLTPRRLQAWSIPSSG